MNPKVSVIVATYRRTDYFKRALDSLFSQTYENIEVIVVDDNDDSEYNDTVKNIVDEAISKYPQANIKLIVNHPNLGSAKARNAGISDATGEYVTFLDDDDIYGPSKIENQVRHMTVKNSDYSITDLELYDTSDNLVERRTRTYIMDYSKDSLLKYHFMYHMTGTDTMMFKKEYLNEIGMFDAIDVGDEFYLMKKAIVGGGKFSYLNHCDVKAYVHTSDGGLSSGITKINGENQLYEFKRKYFENLDNKSVRYIKMRHHAVLAFAYLRMKKIPDFFCESVKSFLSSPLASLRLFVNLKN